MPLFKHLTPYRIGPDWRPPVLEALEAELQRLTFQPCTATQELSVGWVPPRGEAHAAMVEVVGGQWLMKLAIERRAVPAAAVRAELEARCQAIEQAQGRKPGRKEKSELKEDIVHALLPRAFSKRSTQLVWLDPASRLLAVGVGSAKAAEAAITSLVDVMAQLRCVLPLALVNTATAPATAMAHWLTTQEAPAGFTVDRDLELKHPGEERSVVRYARHTLALEEIARHIEEGKLPTQLALTWEGRVSFVLTDTLALRRLELLDAGQDGAPQEEGFDADAAIATGELAGLLPDLWQALGGEMEAGQGPVASS